jgi:hypothetical protein
MASSETRAISLDRVLKVVVFLTLLTASTLTWMSPVKGGGFESSVQEPDEVVLTLKPEGFIPAEITRGAGRFQLSVDNRSEVEELTLHLKKADGSQLREIRVARGGGDWSEVFDLTPGSYTLSEANHSNWVCQITVN